MARPAPSHWRLYKDSQRDHVFSPSAAATFACAVLVLAIGLRSTSGFAWFVHESGHTDAPIFYAIAHDADWGVTRLEPQHIAPGLAAFGLVAVNVLAASAGTLMLRWWSRRHGASPAWGWLFPCSLGFLTVLFFDLSEGLLWALLLSALVAYDRRAIRATALLLTLALFTKETALIIVAAIGLAALVRAVGRDPLAGSTGGSIRRVSGAAARVVRPDRSGGKRHTGGSGALPRSVHRAGHRGAQERQRARVSHAHDCDTDGHSRILVALGVVAEI